MADPDGSGQLERHGTELAGILVGAGGPAGISGVATGATVLPIRVAGWQRDLTGNWAVYSRTDQLIEGLERAVDPNVDGDAHDAARIALIGVAAPFGAFADSPEARAIRGALRLDTLVVTPVGNDGPAGPGYGSVSSPGGAPDALTVGAADLRPEAEELPIAVRTGLDLLLDRPLPLAGAVVSARPMQLELAAPRLRLREPLRRSWGSSSTGEASASSPAAPRSCTEATTRSSRPSTRPERAPPQSCSTAPSSRPAASASTRASTCPC